MVLAQTAAVNQIREAGNVEAAAQMKGELSGCSIAEDASGLLAARPAWARKCSELFGKCEFSQIQTRIPL